MEMSIKQKRKLPQQQFAMFNDNKHEDEDTRISSLQAEVEHLRQENQRLTQRLKETELLMDIHREVSQILSFMLDTKLSNTSPAASSHLGDSVNCLARQILPVEVRAKPVQAQ